MRIVNLMNFVRKCDPRIDDSEQILFEATQKELALVKEYGIDNTFLLQYDALVDNRYLALFQQEADGHTELGLWYEIVKPLTDKAGLPWCGKEGWTWDWHIVPGFSMAYTQTERKRLVDIAMEDFKDIYGYYPRTVASWLIDSYTVSYLAKKYDVSAIAICRDQTATDAYTLVGGYFNQGYYPSKKNLFTPAQTEEYRVKVPVFRLLGPDPVHNYDNDRYLTDPKQIPYTGCYTLEPVWKTGSTPEIVEWFFRNYFENEDLGFSYAQLGQENSFGPSILPALRMQLEKLKAYPEVRILKMCDTGEWYKDQFPDKTPATCVSALDDWGGKDEIQSVYYDCRNYTANLFRYKNRIFIRSMYLFDERVEEQYLEKPCETWDALYENLPVIDTLIWKDNEGLLLDEEGTAFSLSRLEEGVLDVQWQGKRITFSEERIRVWGLKDLYLDFTGNLAEIQLRDEKISYCYKGHDYLLCVSGGNIKPTEHGCEIMANDSEMILTMEGPGCYESI